MRSGETVPLYRSLESECTCLVSTLSSCRSPSVLRVHKYPCDVCVRYALFLCIPPCTPALSKRKPMYNNDCVRIKPVTDSRTVLLPVMIIMRHDVVEEKCPCRWNEINCRNFCDESCTTCCATMTHTVMSTPEMWQCGFRPI